jgi:hypothetical protein
VSALAKRGLAALAIVATTLLGARAWQSRLAPPLRPWHTHVPPEPGAARIDALDWEGYLRDEASALVALPFPETDALYGSRPDPSEDFGIALGALAARGERGALVVSLDAFLVERVDGGIPGPRPPGAPGEPLH